MNITHFVENLNRGGLERVVIDLAAAQQAAGHQCQVVCLYQAGDLANELTDIGIAVHACDKRRGLDMGALSRARRAVREHVGTILHTHNSVAHYQAVLATLGLPLQCIVNSRHGMGTVRASRREWFYHHSLCCTDAVVTVCAASRDVAIARGILPPAKSRVIANGIQVEQFSPASDDRRRRLQQMLGLSAETQIIGTVGRLTPAKHQAGLIESFARLQSALPATALVLIGDGELRAELEQCAHRQGVARSVHFLGDRDDVAELLQGLDVFALSSLSEGYSMALLEACASALPIVATDVGGNAEIVRDHVTGRLVPAQAAEPLAQAMLELLRDRDQARTLAQAARVWVEREGSLAAMADHYDSLYVELAEHPAA